MTQLQDDYCSDYIIEPWEIELKLSEICVNKSPGPDCIPNWFLREMAPFVAEPLCAIFNLSVKQGSVPAYWKHANVVPVPKTQPPKNIYFDLRPISLMSTLVKVFESFIGNWILDKINNKLDKDQYGAVKGRSTVHALVSILHQWSCALDRGESVRALFVDYTKAFDHIDHTILLNKLMTLGVPHFLVKWMFSFLSQRKQRVKVNGALSEWITLTGAMPQGTWLGPLMFISFIHDLMPSCPVHKFIDDVTLTELLKRNDSCSIMDDIVEELIKWSVANKMIISCNKTKEMILGGIRSNPPQELTVNENQIEQVSVFKLLGVYVSDDLLWDQNIEKICNKVSTKLYFLKLLKRAGLSLDDLRYFYIAVVRPVLEYACVVWNHSLTKTQSDRLESLQKRALRIIYGDLATGNPYLTVLPLVKLESLQERRHKLSKFFFDKICQEDNCLHDLLPPERDPTLLTKLRHPNRFPLPVCRTKRYQSFINYGLHKYQD